MATSKRPDWASTMAKHYYFFLYFDISTVTSSDNKDIKSQNGDAVISNVVVFQTTITKTNRLTTYEIQNTCPQKWPGIAVKRLKHVFWRWLPIPALILKMIKYTTNACGSDEMLSLPPHVHQMEGESEMKSTFAHFSSNPISFEGFHRDLDSLARKLPYDYRSKTNQK